jgi:DNA-binding transcriptional LysR family regulator
MLENLVAFTRVIDKQGFAKAARDLRLSTPVITRRIKDLETELGIKLIQRSTRKLAITEAGQLFYERAKDIIYALESAKSAVTSLKDDICGTIKIGIPASLNHLYLIPALPALLKKYPGLKVDMIQGNHLIDLLDKGFDLILHCGELPDSSYHFRKLGEWTKITCAAPAYFRKHKKPQTPQDLAKHNCLDHADNRSCSWGYNLNDSLQKFLINGNVKANSSVDLKTLALSGLGIAYLPSFTIWPELGSKQLVSILDEFNPKPLGMYIIYPSNQFMNKKTRAFIDFLEDMMKPFFNCGFGLNKN